ncbi:MAG: DUF5777 family beta-barrel protein [Saprospiraceae bacterium]|nr:DUF5777 family beta-barrel protein [Saprospiraceae bacterium]
MKSTIIYIFVLCFGLSLYSFGQDKQYTYQTFKDTRIINTQSVEVLQHRQLDVRISHRFGDMFGANGGWQTFYGLENAADIAIGCEYGLMNKLTLGLHRTKGAGQLRQLLNGVAKYRILHQTNGNEMPISMTVVGGVGLSTMRKDTVNKQSLANFPKGFAHRLLYSLELHVARKFGDAFSLQLSPSFVWRNNVLEGDENALFGVGIAMRIQLSKSLGLILDGNFPLSSSRFTSDSGYFSHIPLGLGLEMETGGHVFQINFTNASGIMLYDYLPNTDANWGLGQFRLGFTISRLFRF